MDRDNLMAATSEYCSTDQVPEITLIGCQGPSDHTDRNRPHTSILQGLPVAILILASDLSDFLWMQT